MGTIHALSAVPLVAEHELLMRLHNSTLLPTWDADRRALSVAGVVVKRFKRPAINQQAILAAFQEEGWRSKIDDPLSPVEGIDSKRRLNDAICSLNKHHRHRLIQFHGDGTGQGIIWEAVQ